MNGYRASNGVYRTKSLFVEQNRSPEVPVYTLKEFDHELNGVTYPSLRQLYLSCRDPSEHTFALAAFGSWEQWVKLQEAIWFIPHLKGWRLELEALMNSDAYKLAYDVLNDLKASASARLAALKIISSSRSPKKRGKGRPANHEAPDNSAFIASEEDDDAKRIGLVN